MSNKKIVLFLLVFFLASVQAMKAQDYPVIYASGERIYDIMYIDDDTFVVLMHLNPQELRFVKMNEEGVILGEVFFLDIEQEDFIDGSEILRLPDGSFGFYYLTGEEGIVRLKLAKVNQELDLDIVVFDWEGTETDFGTCYPISFNNFLMDNDGQTVFSYAPPIWKTNRFAF